MPGVPILEMTSVAMRPKAAAPNWETKYAEAYKAGKMKIALAKAGDELLKIREPHDLTIPITEERAKHAQRYPLMIADCVTVAREWVQSQLASLNLRNWTEKTNEGDTIVQVKGVVYDEFLLQHEFDVRVSKEDGRIQNGSYAK
jgi:hypothetical protein